MLHIDCLTKKFFEGTPNEITAIDGLNLELREGDFVTIIGSNGAGKTTLLDLIAGVHPPTRGRITINGHDVSSVPEFRRAMTVGRVYQNPLLGTASSMTVAENLCLAMKKGGRGLRIGVTRNRRERFKEELVRLNLGLEHRLDDQVKHLSGGQRQALTVLMSTLTVPVILLLDEHTAALDPSNAQRILEITQELVREKGLTTLMVTHNMKQAIEVGNRLVMLHAGQVILDVNGEQKSTLRIKDLLDFFAQRDLVEDELMLVN